MNLSSPEMIERALRLPRKDKLRLVKILKQRQILRARQDPAYFIEYAIPHEKTKKPVKNEQFHRDWHQFFSDNNWGIISASVEHGKTQSITIGRAIWELGHDPTLRIAVIGQVDDAVKKLGRPIRRHIEKNPRVHEVFPDLRRSSDPKDSWTGKDMIVEGAGTSAKEASIQCRGVGAGDILGSRLDLVLVDDILNIENTRTKIARDRLSTWFEETILTRIYDDAEADIWGRIFLTGNPWDSDDLMGRLRKLPGWAFMETPAVLNPNDPPNRWVPTWPRMWPLKRLFARRDIMTPHAFARKYLCKVLDASQRRFKWSWLQHMLRLGKGRILLKQIPVGRHGELLRCFTGLDPAAGEKDADAVSCLFTIALDHMGRRIVVDVRSGHWTGPEILDQCEVVCRMFNSLLLVEGNAVQRWMRDFAAGVGVSAVAVNTGTDKWSEEYGVESLAVEMRGGLWVAPSGPTGKEVPPEVDEWIRECYDFDPAAHTGDRLMASWIALKGARGLAKPREQESNHGYR